MKGIGKCHKSGLCFFFLSLESPLPTSTAMVVGWKGRSREGYKYLRCIMYFEYTLRAVPLVFTTPGGQILTLLYR